MIKKTNRGARDRAFEKELANLKPSPLFSLSLGSRELFHSNFLSWVGGVYPQQAGRLFARFLQTQSGDCSLTAAPDREKKNIDVWFKFNNGAELILENKVKSIPTEQQLQAYTEEQLAYGGGQKNFLLLSLTKPHFANAETFRIGTTAWHFLDYAGLSALVNSLIEEIKHPYHREILRDYAQFTMSLHRIGEYADIDFEQDTFSFNHGEIVEQLKAVRMADFYLKKEFAIIAEELATRMEQKFPGTIKRNDWNTARKCRNDHSGTIFVNSGMTRAQGLVEMMYVIEPGLCLGVQIQENRYKKFVVGKRAQEIAAQLKNKGVWFDFPASIDRTTTYPQDGRDFNCYSDEFYYRYAIVPTGLKISDAIDCVVGGTEEIRLLRPGLSGGD